MSLALFALAVGAALVEVPGSRWLQRAQRTLLALLWSGLALATCSGALMMLDLDSIASLSRLGYTGFEVGLGVALLAASVRLLSRPILDAVARAPKDPAAPRQLRKAPREER